MSSPSPPPAAAPAAATVAADDGTNNCAPALLEDHTVFKHSSGDDCGVEFELVDEEDEPPFLSIRSVSPRGLFAAAAGSSTATATLKAGSKVVRINGRDAGALLSRGGGIGGVGISPVEAALSLLRDAEEGYVTITTATTATSRKGNVDADAQPPPPAAAAAADETGQEVELSKRSRGDEVKSASAASAAQRGGGAADEEGGAGHHHQQQLDNLSVTTDNLSVVTPGGRGGGLVDLDDAIFDAPYKKSKIGSDGANAATKAAADDSAISPLSSSPPEERWDGTSLLPPAAAGAAIAATGLCDDGVDGDGDGGDDGEEPKKKESIMDAARSKALRPFVIISTSYLLFTVTDGAIRMIVLLHAYNKSFSALEVAIMFTLYELAGVFTNLAAGFLGARWGIKYTLVAGLLLQLFSYGLLFGWQDSWTKGEAIVYVTIAQMFAGIAKDLTKLGGKTVTKLVTPSEKETKLFKLVSLLTGWKNSLKGVGYFLGSALIEASYFAALGTMMGLVLLAIPWAVIGLDRSLGTAKKENATWRQVFKWENKNLTILSVARLFLFASRDFWFEVPLPFFLRSPQCAGLGTTECSIDSSSGADSCFNGATCVGDVCQSINIGGGCGGVGLPRVVVGAFLGGYIILYGQVQSWTPQLVTGPLKQTPPNKLTEVFWGLINCIPTLVATIVMRWSPSFQNQDQTAMTVWLVVVIVSFAVVFAINSSIHSFLVVKYASHDKVAVSVGLYYMSNAMGRLVGTIGSGLLYTYVGESINEFSGSDAVAGLTACFLAGTISSFVAAIITIGIDDGQVGLKCGSCWTIVKSTEPDVDEGDYDEEEANKVITEKADTNTEIPVTAAIAAASVQRSLSKTRDTSSEEGAANAASRASQNTQTVPCGVDNDGVVESAEAPAAMLSPDDLAAEFVRSTGEEGIILLPEEVGELEEAPGITSADINQAMGDIGQEMIIDIDSKSDYTRSSQSSITILDEHLINSMSDGSEMGQQSEEEDAAVTDEALGSSVVGAMVSNAVHDYGASPMLDIEDDDYSDSPIREHEYFEC